MSGEMSPSGYVFVLTLIDPQANVPYQIIPKHFLQKADSDQISKIKALLQRFNANHMFMPPYEHDIVLKPIDKPGDGHFEYQGLPPEKWRYWIIHFEGTNSELHELEYALSLMEQDIELGFFVISGEGIKGDGCGWHSQYLPAYFTDDDRQVVTPKKIAAGDLQLAGECYSKLKSLPQQYAHIRRAFDRFATLKAVPRSSELAVIGLFSVMESLLTHAPKPGDPTDSLVRQIRHKIPLVRKRFRRALDHNGMFGNLDEDNLWKKLYEYRSKVVHGEDAKLSGNLSALKDRRTVVCFLREVVKLLLIQSLDELVLMTDLKEC